MMRALQYIAQHDNELNFISMLLLSGYDGTFAPRRPARSRRRRQSVGQDRRAAGAYNPVGFITTASGQRMAFVQYLSGYAVPPEDQKQRRAPLVRFESRLYRDIYQNN